MFCVDGLAVVPRGVRDGERVVAAATGWGVCVAASPLALYTWKHRGNVGVNDPVRTALPATASALACSREGERIFVALSSGRLLRWLRRQGAAIAPMPGLPLDVDVVEVALGEEHCLALCGSSGAVWAWGSNRFGELGIGGDAIAALVVPTRLAHLERCEHIAAGWSSSAAVAASGALFTWGWGRYSQLGHGASADERAPRVVEALRGVAIARVACGAWHTAAVSKDSVAYAWGWNRHGQLGARTAGDGASGSAGGAASGVALRSVPRLVRALNDAMPDAVHCGARHTIWIDSLNCKAWACGFMGGAAVKGAELGAVCALMIPPTFKRGSLACASGSSAWHALLLGEAAEGVDDE